MTISFPLPWIMDKPRTTPVIIAIDNDECIGSFGMLKKKKVKAFKCSRMTK